MATETFAREGDFSTRDTHHHTVSSSGVSWAAIFAGALAAVTVSLILVAIGSGIGLASVSPWQNAGASAAAFSITAAVWLVITQWLASGVGGYLAGRLRARWHGTHAHEVFFRDTAHGFLAWSLATVATLALLAMTAGSGVRGANEAGGAIQRSAGATPDKSSSVFAYDVDTLFRTTRPDPSPSIADARLQADRILAAGMANNAVSADDGAYLAQLITQQTGVAPIDAQARVQSVIAREQDMRRKLMQKADEARKAASAVSIFTALSMLIGAFVASVAAALGGQRREQHP